MYAAALELEDSTLVEEIGVNAAALELALDDSSALVEGLGV